jgi:hypothetical protein
VRTTRCLLLVALTGLVTAGCGGRMVDGTPSAQSSPALADRPVITAYFERSNAAAQEGAEAQRRFLHETQHPDYSDAGCNLGELTLVIDPTLSTLRPDAGWRPLNSDDAPRGRVYVVAVTVTVQRDKAVVATQIGSVHVVVLDGEAYGFAPCPA